MQAKAPGKVVNRWRQQNDPLHQMRPPLLEQGGQQAAEGVAENRGEATLLGCLGEGPQLFKEGVDASLFHFAAFRSLKRLAQACVSTHAWPWEL